MKWELLALVIYTGLFIPVATYLAQVNWLLAWGLFWVVVFTVLSIAALYLLLGYRLQRLMLRVWLRADRVYTWIVREWERDRAKLRDAEAQCQQYSRKTHQLQQAAADANRAQEVAERSLASAQQHIRDQDNYIKLVQAELLMTQQNVKEARNHVT